MGADLFPQAQIAREQAKERLNETLITMTDIPDNEYQDYLIKELNLSRLMKDEEVKVGLGYIRLIMHARSCEWKSIASWWVTEYITWLSLLRSKNGWQQETFRTDVGIQKSEMRTTPLSEQIPKS